MVTQPKFWRLCEQPGRTCARITRRSTARDIRKGLKTRRAEIFWVSVRSQEEMPPTDRHGAGVGIRPKGQVSANQQFVGSSREPREHQRPPLRINHFGELGANRAQLLNLRANHTNAITHAMRYAPSFCCNNQVVTTSPARLAGKSHPYNVDTIGAFIGG